MGRRKKSSVPRKKFHCTETKKECAKPIESQVTILDIFSRLDKPFARVDDYSDGINVVEYNFRPRRIFINGLCLVCLRFCKSEIICESCKMVSYCSEKHRKENCEEHKVLCSNLKEVYRTENGLQLDMNTTPDEYRIFRVKLIKLIERNIKRSLELWEKEIILYPRICQICYKACNECCAECEMNFVCSVEEHYQEHVKWCSTFKIFRRIAQLQRVHGNTKPQIPNVISEVAVELPNDFDEVVAHLLGGTKLYNDMDSYNYAVLSHLSSVPLTTLYAFQKSYKKEWQKRNNLTIHIIGAEFEFECADLKFWEKMFLHFLPALKELNLVLVGPELQAPQFLLDALTSIQLCKNCSAKKKLIKIEFHTAKLYHDVLLLKPDIICLFNPGLYRRTGYSTWDTWPETINKFCKYKVPVVVTSYTEYEIPRDIARIESICAIEVLLKAQRNSFASLKPDRNFVSDHIVPLIFKNYFITIVKGK